MNAPTAISAMARQVPPAPVLQVLSRYRREDIEAFVAIAIDLMDLADGDPDIENATDAEDEGITAAALEFTDGPGCIIADTDFAVDDQPCDNDDDSEAEDCL